MSKEAVTNMSGLKGVPLIFPTLIMNNKLVHIPSNFQATSNMDRAKQILENGGLLSIKAHIVKSAFGMVALDGVDQIYMNYLDALLTSIDKEYKDDIWWTSMGQIADNIHNVKS